MEGVERKNASQVGINQEEVGIITRIRHRKDAPAIAGEQILGSEAR